MLEVGQVGDFFGLNVGCWGLGFGRWEMGVGEGMGMGLVELGRSLKAPGIWGELRGR